MLDTFKISPTRQDDELFDGFGGEFAIIRVSPRREFGSGGDGLKPVMPLLARGQQFSDDSFDMWTVLRAEVNWSELPFGDQGAFYWYEYVAVAGRHVLR